MTTVIDGHPALAEQQLDQRARDYSDVFAWPTTIDSVTGDVRLQLGTDVDALIMRAGFRRGGQQLPCAAHAARAHRRGSR